jgi:methylmalonyl-CoA/ethylmalonyl-CoA epimerase
MSSPFRFELDHIGIAVENLDAGGAFYRALQMQESDREDVKSEKVKVGFYPLDNDANIELLEPTDGESPIRKFLDKRGPGIHHICLRVNKLDELVAHLKKNNVQLINDVPKIGAHNCRVVFVHPKSAGGVLIELSEPGDH